MLSGPHMADALVAADIARDAMLALDEPAGRVDLAELLGGVGTDRLVVHQATGMIAAQLDASVTDALARLRAAAFESGRSVYEIAQDIVGRQVRFYE
jgi:AmiR/NasT family two-component response regulator